MSKEQLFKKKEVAKTNPKKLIIFGKPKVGKTAILQGLGDDALILELEKNGADYIKGYVQQINSLSDIKALGNKLEETKYPFKYGIVDTITTLEEMVIPLANQIYRSTPMGKNWKGKNVTHLPQGAGDN